MLLRRKGTHIHRCNFHSFIYLFSFFLHVRCKDKYYENTNGQKEFRMSVIRAFVKQEYGQQKLDLVIFSLVTTNYLILQVCISNNKILNYINTKLKSQQCVLFANWAKQLSYIIYNTSYIKV